MTHMNRRNILSLKTIMLIATTCTSMALPGHAQAPSEVPIRIVPVQVAGAGTSLHVVNISPRPITGFVVVIESVRENGTTALKTVRTEGRGDMRINNKMNFFYPADEIRTRAVPLPSSNTGEALKQRISIDMVAFSDGSFWGPQVEVPSATMRGWIDGMRFLRMRSQEVLAKKGLAALESEVSDK